MKQNDRNLRAAFPDGIFKCVFLNEKAWILIKILLKFVPRGLVNDVPALVHIYGLVPVRRQAIIWTNDVMFANVYMRHSASIN